MIMRIMMVCCCALLLLPACSSSQSAHSRRGWKRPAVDRQAYNFRGGRMNLEVNDKVRTWIDYFTGPGHGHFTRYLQRSGRYEQSMKAVLRSKGLPEEIFYLALIESGYRNTAKSWAGAVGTWQFIRGTGRAYGLGINEWVDERRDPDKAVEAAANYLGKLHQEFGDWWLALAGYNSGEGTVRRAIARYGSRDFWELSSPGKRVFRAETREYVPKFIAAAIIAQNPKRFGFRQIDYHSPLKYDTAQVRKQTPLQAVAEAAGVQLAVIEELNPELHAGATPPGHYEVKIPEGRSRQFARNLKSAEKRYQVMVASIPKASAYSVRQGDTLGTIARRHGTTTRQLIAANNLRSSRIRQGQRLRIPSRRTPSAVRSAPVVAQAETVRKVQGTALVDESTRTAQSAERRATYRVQRGDSLSRIARKHGVTVTDLRHWNRLQGNQIKTRQHLYVSAPVRLAPSAERTAPVVAQVETVHKAQGEILVKASTRKAHSASRSAIYKVRRGDALITIAKQHGVTVADVRQWNGITGNRIRVGQKLRIHTKQPTVAAPVRDAQSTIVAEVSAKRNTADGAATRTTDDGQRTTGSYTVHTGDTLGQIAERHNTTTRELRELNRLDRRSMIRAGQKMQVRGSAVATVASAPAAPKPVSWNSTVQKTASTKHLVHKVRPGDTLWDISKLYKVTPESIQEWNNLPKPFIKPGQRLTIRVSS